TVIVLTVPTVPTALPPVAAPSDPTCGSSRDSRAPRQSRPWQIARIGIRVVRILGRGRTINDLRVVRREVNYVRVGWFNYNNLLAARDCLSFHFLLRAGL